MRELNLIDYALCHIDNAVRTIIPPQTRVASRITPGDKSFKEESLSSGEKKHIAGLVRVNHSGEVCAQALYQGQALTAKLDHVKQQMEQAANEENDHLAWCEERLRELNSQPSIFNPAWYLGSLMIGAIAGMAGDRWSLGFVAETEHQVSAHLQRHLEKLPEKDQRSKAILKQMKEDEMHHAVVAKNAGAADLPEPIKMLMRSVAKIMTHTSYYL